MKKVFFFTTLVLLFVLAFALPVFAGVGDFFGGIKDTITSKGVAMVLTALLGISGITATVVFKRVCRTLKEAGEFLTAVGEAFEDGKLSSREIGRILQEGKDVFSIWKVTKYTP